MELFRSKKMIIQKMEKEGKSSCRLTTSSHLSSRVDKVAALSTHIHHLIFSDGYTFSSSLNPNACADQTAQLNWRPDLCGSVGVPGQHQQQNAINQPDVMSSCSNSQKLRANIRVNPGAAAGSSGGDSLNSSWTPLLHLHQESVL